MGFASSGIEGQASLMGSYSKTNYGKNSFSKSIKYTAAVSINLFPTTEIQLSYTQGQNFVNNDPVQTITIQEQILSLTVNQTLVPPRWLVQPYVKVGAAQYNRRQGGTISGIPETEIYTQSPSAVAGLGMRFFIASQFSLNGELVTYVPDFVFSEAKNNLSAQGGIGWHF